MEYCTPVPHCKEYCTPVIHTSYHLIVRSTVHLSLICLIIWLYGVLYTCHSHGLNACHVLSFDCKGYCTCVTHCKGYCTCVTHSKGYCTPVTHLASLCLIILIVRTTVHLSLTWACYLSLTLRRGTGAGATPDTSASIPSSELPASPQQAQQQQHPPQQPPGVSLVRWWVVVAGLHLVWVWCGVVVAGLQFGGGVVVAGLQFGGGVVVAGLHFVWVWCGGGGGYCEFGNGVGVAGLHMMQVWW